MPLVADEAAHLEHREQILLDRHAPEDRGLLREVADPPPRAQVHRQLGDLLTVERDAAAVRRDQAEDAVERGRLARAVRSEQPDDLAGGDIDRDAVDDAPAAEAFLQPRGAEAARGGNLPPRGFHGLRPLRSERQILVDVTSVGHASISS
jgi:hypothetical protein